MSKFVEDICKQTLIFFVELHVGSILEGNLSIYFNLNSVLLLQSCSGLSL